MAEIQLQRRPHDFACSAVVLFLISALGGTARAADDAAVDFARDIQPLFAQKCLLCHGPDEQESGLRLDRRDLAIAPAESGAAAIVSGDPLASELIKRVTSSDDDERMPPEGDPLTADEVARLRDWIAAGARYDTHWAYRPLAAETLPHVLNADWARNEIDHFVLSRLEAADIEPAPTADRYTLIKRLYYDLHGIPPTVAAVDSFVADKHPDAYERLVDRLLASPRFAERWGRHWLDKARYADSDGYEKDNNRPDAWRYRDWVIEAIQRDLPFDQFTVEQLAGDMLPHRDDNQLLATAFNRQTLTNTEGGTDREQWRVAAVMDRTETIGSVWLGLTVGCARCHNHKYDQLTQREYYELFAYFDNADEINADVGISSARMTRFESAKAEHDGKVAALRNRLDKARSQALVHLTGWEEDARRRLAEIALTPLAHHDVEIGDVHTASGKELRQQDDGSWLASHRDVTQDTYSVVVRAPAAAVTGLVLDLLPHAALPKNGPGLADNGNFVLSELTVMRGDDSPVAIARASADFSQKDWPVSHCLDGDEATGWAVMPESGKTHRATFRFAAPLELSAADELTIVLDQRHKEGKHLIGCFRVRLQTGIDPEDVFPAPIRAALQIAANERTAEQRATLEKAFLATSAVYTQSQSELEKLIAAAPKPPRMKARVLGQRAQDRRRTFILRRGEFRQKLDPVEAGAPATLVTSADEPASRLDFARWLVAGENPLVPRVTVNHICDHLFGFGLVRTLNDFGVRGERPSHPKLLDWLAGEYIELGWSRKRIIKTIVMSATYRQSSRHRSELYAVDPTNQLLHRQNRFRLEAEAMRDSCLSVAGLLADTIGGPSVFPPIPSGITDLNYNSSFKWNTSQGEDRYRRGMYTYFKRTAPHPNLTTLDCPDSNVTCVKRDRSNTPLAALITLNNAVYHETAQALARRALSWSADSDQARLAHVIRTCVARPAEEYELVALRELLQTSRDWYADHADAADKLVGPYSIAKETEDEDENEKVANTELAAWVATVRIVLNFDEFITRE